MANVKKAKMEDRISLLPDFVLLHILSSLNTKAVVQTCVLSKRWKTLWTRIPVLNFHYLSDPYYRLFGPTVEEKSRMFKKFVSKFASQHRGTHIRKLFHSGYTKELSLIVGLVRFAQRRNVQELRINTSYMGYYDWINLYSTCSSLTSLTIISGFVDDWGALVSPSLKILEIDCGWLQDGGFGRGPYKGIKTFSGCPNLESLVLIDYYVQTATICAPKLKNLELYTNFEAKAEVAEVEDNLVYYPELELITPLLENVYFNNVLPTVKSTSSKFWNLHKVNIEVTLYDCTNRRKSAKSLFELLRVFHTATSFILPLKEMQFYKVVSSVPSLSGITFHNLKHLKIKIGTSEDMKRLDLPVSLMALKCPNLETLDVINQVNHSRTLTDPTYF